MGRGLPLIGRGGGGVGKVFQCSRRGARLEEACFQPGPRRACSSRVDIKL